jgi:hypothetical protein
LTARLAAAALVDPDQDLGLGLVVGRALANAIRAIREEPW